MLWNSLKELPGLNHLAIVIDREEGDGQQAEHVDRDDHQVVAQQNLIGKIFAEADHQRAVLLPLNGEGKALQAVHASAGQALGLLRRQR